MRQFAVSAVQFQACAAPDAALGFAPRDVALNTLGDPGWLGKLRRSWKCRSAWKSTCTPALRASKTDGPATASMAHAVEAVVVSAMRIGALTIWTAVTCGVVLAPACASAEEGFDTE